MDEKKFLAKIAEIVEEDEANIKMDTVLDSLDSWDSLARITFLVFASDECRRRIDGSLVKDAATVSDLYRLISE